MITVRRSGEEQETHRRPAGFELKLWSVAPSALFGTRRIRVELNVYLCEESKQIGLINGFEVGFCRCNLLAGYEINKRLVHKHVAPSLADLHG